MEHIWNIYRAYMKYIWSIYEMCFKGICQGITKSFEKIGGG